MSMILQIASMLSQKLKELDEDGEIYSSSLSIPDDDELWPAKIDGEINLIWVARIAVAAMSKTTTPMQQAGAQIIKANILSDAIDVSHNFEKIARETWSAMISEANAPSTIVGVIDQYDSRTPER